MSEHNQEKEAIEDGLNCGVLSYRGVVLGTVALTMTSKWITHEDGSITGPGYAPPSIAVSQELKAIIDAYLDAQPPAPPPSPPPAPPPTDGDYSGALAPGETYTQPGDA